MDINKDLQSVNSYDWSEMSVSDLNEQLQLLRNRRLVLLELGKRDMFFQLERGIQHLEAILNQKLNKQPSKVII